MRVSSPTRRASWRSKRNGRFFLSSVFPYYGDGAPPAPVHAQRPNRTPIRPLDVAHKNFVSSSAVCPAATRKFVNCVFTHDGRRSRRAFRTARRAKVNIVSLLFDNDSPYSFHSWPPDFCGYIRDDRLSPLRVERNVRINGVLENANLAPGQNATKISELFRCPKRRKSIRFENDVKCTAVTYGRKYSAGHHQRG